ncbi:Transcriptional regulatory protein UhpA [Streptomyces netropsis]|uniref:Two-component system response regulator DesR n=1 Tax=Streptomyces syringium TaxID=76729 RepID=A0ABS4Y1T2_9ACTN|nr:response regulator transcription factor [Streptomyces syringium]MBP2402615.1 two-component system response regulator DesR [Streptomyces syringium]SPE49512.1 Transcriptional regulatory protein UhpA [Streptomyces netropsis]
MIRVLLVHDTYLLRTALAALIGREADLEVSSTSWPGAVATSRTLRPQVCVVDMDSADAVGPRGIRELSRRCYEGDGGFSLLALASAGRPGPLRRAYEERALGFLSKNASPDRLVEGIRHVAKGERYIDESLGFGFLEASEMPLTRRELSVLSLAAEGASIGEIARSLCLSNGTVRNYMAAITRKTGARNRVDAIRISQCAGWV